MDNLNEKTVERLSLYRQLLRREEQLAHDYFYSHDLADLAHVSSVQVRRDLMHIGYAGSNRKGYETKEVLLHLGELLDTPGGTRVAIAGLGNLGKALANFFTVQRGAYQIVALFDIDPSRVDRPYCGAPCYHIDRLVEVVNREKITVGIIATAIRSAQTVSSWMVDAGISSIINFTQTPLNLPDHVFLDQINMTTSLEKAAFFSHRQQIRTQEQQRPRKVLIMDDDIDIRTAYQTLIEAAGFQVECAASGDAGMQVLESSPPDLIVLDVMMENPDSGFLFLNELREKGYAIPVILSSSIARATANLLDVNQLNIKTILQKPVDLDELIRIINKLLGVKQL